MVPKVITIFGYRMLKFTCPDIMDIIMVIIAADILYSIHLNRFRLSDSMVSVSPQDARPIATKAADKPLKVAHSSGMLTLNAFDITS